ENLPRAILEVGRISIARHKDVARNEALEDITTREERDAMPFLQQQNSARDVEEIGIGDLEKFVARKCLEDFDERLAIVTARIEAGLVQDALEFQPQHRNLAHAAAVRGRG